MGRLKTGEDLLQIFVTFVGDWCNSFQETMNGLVRRGFVYDDGYDENYDEVYIVTEAGVNAVGKRIDENWSGFRREASEEAMLKNTPEMNAPTLDRWDYGIDCQV